MHKSEHAYCRACRVLYFVHAELPPAPRYQSSPPFLHSQVDEVKGVMVQNVESVLARGERLELLVDKTDALQMNAAQFQRQGRALRWGQGGGPCMGDWHLYGRRGFRVGTPTTMQGT